MIMNKNSIIPLKFSNKVFAGIFIFLGSTCFLFGMLISEELYSGYSTTQMISDLGIGETADIFNASIIIFGLLLVIAAYLLKNEGIDTWFCVFMLFAGIGQVCVGLFPENTGITHLIAAVIVFVFGVIISIISIRVFSVPWAWISAGLGIITIFAMALFETKTYLGLGSGGIERIMTYPLLIWAFGTGACFLASEK